MLTRLCQKTIELPSNLSKAFRNILAEEDMSMVLSDGSILASYLLKRGMPPATTSNFGMSTFLNYNILNDQDLKEKILKQRWEKKLLDYNVIVYKRRHTMGYLASRAVGTYGSTYRVLKEMSIRLPHFAPRSILDFGSGVGCTHWAVDSIWGRENKIFHSVDLSESMLELAGRVRLEGGLEFQSIHDIRETRYLPGLGAHDLVVAAYTLSDLPSIEMINKTLSSLWHLTKNFLVLIEYGNTAGHSILSNFRQDLIREGKKLKYSEPYNPVFAPCPHALKCPLLEEGCYFKQRTGLSIVQDRDLLYKKKTTTTKHFNEKFSYLILAKPSAGQFMEQTQPLMRLVGPTLKRTRHVITQLCVPSGEIQKRIFTKGKHSPLYKDIRKDSEWGDVLRISETPSKDKGVEKTEETEDEEMKQQKLE